MNALCLPLLFFLHSFHPEVSPIPLLGIAFWQTGWRPDFNKWIKELQKTYGAPNPHVLLLVPDNQGGIVNFTDPDNWYLYTMQDWEWIPFPDEKRNYFGMIVVQKPDSIIPTNKLEYYYTALVRGGKLVIVDDRKVLMVISKDAKKFEPEVMLNIPHLNDHDLDFIEHLLNVIPGPANRFLLIGETRGWIEPLRKKGWLAQGITTQDYDPDRGVYYQTIRSYHSIPIQSNFFKMIFNFTEMDIEIMYDIASLLVPGAMLLTVPQANAEYEVVLKYLGLTKLSISFHQMPIWFKPLGESA